MNTIHAERPLEIAECCELWNMGKSTFHKRMAEGLIKTIVMGRRRLVPREEALRIAREGFQPAKKPGRKPRGV